MTASDPSLCEMTDALSSPMPTDPTSVSRRRFLQAAAAGVGGTMLPWWLSGTDVVGASGPTGGGTVVLVMLDGGNDALHMVPPYTDGAYFDARGALAWTSDTALQLNSTRGLHPALTKLKDRFDRGEVAIVDGVGNAQRDLSHFSSMADLQHGGTSSSFGRTGWVGRFLDQTAAGPFDGIAIGNRVPLIAQGASRSAVTLPWQHERVPDRLAWAEPMNDALGHWSGTTTGHGALADGLAEATGQMMDAADDLRPSYPTSAASSKLAGELRLCAGLVNAGLGARVLTVRHGPYDSHAAQGEMHGDRMRELDAAIETFFTTLDPDVADDVTVLCMSEFGRRVAANGGNGTDHGAGQTVLAIGRPVVGGFHGELPSLTALTPDGNLRHDIDYRSIVATVLDRGLGADSAEILGGSFPHVPFLAPVVPPVDIRDGGTDILGLSMQSGPALRQRRGIDGAVTEEEAEVLRLARAFLDREPDAETAERVLQSQAGGATLASIADDLAASSEFRDRVDPLSDTAFVDSLHQSLFGRAPTEAERRDLVRRLEAGTLDRAGVVLLLAGSEAYRRRFPYTARPGWSPGRGARAVGAMARASG